MAGITDQGFVLLTLNDILAELDADLRASLGADLNLSADSVAAILRGAPAVQFAATWELAQQIIHAYDPDQAVGAQLDGIAAFNGLRREGALVATGSIDVTGTSGTVIPAGSLARDPVAEVTVETVSSVTIAGGVATIPVRTLTPGAVNSLADGITVIVTPVSGWTAISGSTLTAGQDRESDFALRARIASSSQTTASVDGAIRAGLEAIEGVTTAIVLSNRTNATDAFGTPPKAFQTIISPDLTGQTDLEVQIAESIFRTQPAGILSAGIGPTARTYNVTDDQGFTQAISWSYVVDVPTYYALTLAVDLTVGAITADQAKELAKGAIVSAIGALAIGQDVVVPQLIGALVMAIPGLTSAAILLGTAPAPVGTSNITIDFNKIATVTDGDIAVTLS